MTAERIEQHYKPREVAKRLAVSYRTVMRWFKDDPRCLAWGEDETVNRRGYRSLRIPESLVLEKVQTLRNSSTNHPRTLPQVPKSPIMPHGESIT